MGELFEVASTAGGDGGAVRSVSAGCWDAIVRGASWARRSHWSQGGRGGGRLRERKETRTKRGKSQASGDRGKAASPHQPPQAGVSLSVQCPKRDDAQNKTHVGCLLDDNHHRAHRSADVMVVKGIKPARASPNRACDDAHGWWALSGLARAASDDACCPPACVMNQRR